MAKIPTGSFGYRTPQSQDVTPTAQPDMQVGDAVARVGGIVTANAGQFLAEQQQEQRRLALEKKTQDEMLARSRGGDSLLDLETTSKSAVESIKDKVQRGELPYEKARQEYDGVMSRFKPQTFGPEHLLVGEQYARSAERLRFQARTAIDQVVDTAQRAELKTNFNDGFDRLGKLALLPDTPLEEVFAKADAVGRSGRAAGIPEPEIAKKVQDFKDTTRFQRAQGDLVVARRDVGSLDVYQQRLETGDLSTTLDPDKRIALLKEVDTLRFQAQNLAQHAADKREKLAERAITTTTKQIEAGVPLTATGWTTLRSTVEGTPYASDFNALVEQERETQKVLRMPMSDQQTYIQDREAKLAQDGGTLADKANLQRIKATLESNTKQLAEEPLVASQRLFGKPVQPLDPNDLLQPGGAGRAAAIFADRAATLTAMQKQFGGQVGAKPLLPQEAGLLTKALDKASPADTTQLFGVLRGAIGDDDTYRAAMQQLAPDSPVKARAGMLAAVDRVVTTQSNTFAADVRVSSARVAETMLIGDSILNKTKGQKADDGQARSLFVPPRADFSASFVDAVGNLYRSRPGAQEGDLQAALAYYVGKAAETGRMSSGKDIDANLVKEAITATLGAVVDVNGQGSVKAPLGMNSSEMQSKLRERFAETVKEQGLPPSAIASFEHYGVVNYRRDGTYLLTLGGVPVLGRNGAPLTIDLDPPPLTGTRYRRGAAIPGQSAPAAGSQP